MKDLYEFFVWAARDNISVFAVIPLFIFLGFVLHILALNVRDACLSNDEENSREEREYKPTVGNVVKFSDFDDSDEGLDRSIWNWIQKIR